MTLEDQKDIIPSDGGRIRNAIAFARSEALSKHFTYNSVLLKVFKNYMILHFSYFEIFQLKKFRLKLLFTITQCQLPIELKLRPNVL